jgi:hypothetical protein
MQSSNVSNVWRPRQAPPTGPAIDRFRRPAHTEEQTLFLRRFQSLLEKRVECAERFPVSDWRRRLIDKALYSTYRDCLDLDVGDEVRDILERGRTGARGKSVATA